MRYFIFNLFLFNKLKFYFLILFYKKKLKLIFKTFKMNFKKILQINHLEEKQLIS